MPDRLSLLRPDRLGQHHQRARPRVADEPRQNESAAGVRDEADARESLQELRRFRREHDVGRQARYWRPRPPPGR